jgi:asparagine synthase (glutamine-hydrolysing)
MLTDTLPSEIVHRSKRGFTLPFEHWLRGELRAEVEPVLAKKFGDGPLAAILNGNQASRIWQDFLEGTTSWTRPWSLYVLDRWCELHSLTA